MKGETGFSGGFFCLGMYIHVAGRSGRVRGGSLVRSAVFVPLLWGVHIDVRVILWCLHSWGVYMLELFTHCCSGLCMLCSSES